MHLKLLIIDYKAHYGKFRESNQSMVSNESAVIFQEFLMVHDKCNRILKKVENILGKDVDGEREMICGMKLMMQWLGLELGVPGIVPLGRQNAAGKDFNQLWKIMRRDLVTWKDLIDLSAADLEQEAEDIEIYVYERKLQQILKSNDQSIELIDEFIYFLDDLYEKYFMFF